MLGTSVANAEKIRIALAETSSDELAAFFVVLDRAKANGLDYEWTAFSDEELAIQAVLSGQMDIGFGTPYSAMQRSKAPLRIIFQLSKLKFSRLQQRSTLHWKIWQVSRFSCTRAVGVLTPLLISSKTR